MRSFKSDFHSLYQQGSLRVLLGPLHSMVLHLESLTCVRLTLRTTHGDAGNYLMLLLRILLVSFIDMLQSQSLKPARRRPRRSETTRPQKRIVRGEKDALSPALSKPQTVCLRSSGVFTAPIDTHLATTSHTYHQQNHTNSQIWPLI